LHLQYYSLVGLRLKFRHALKLSSQLKVRLVRLPALPPPTPDKPKLLANLACASVVLGFPDDIFALEQSKVDCATREVARVPSPCDLGAGGRAAFGVERILLGLRAAALDHLES
jgi:hypothetical protein